MKEEILIIEDSKYKYHKFDLQLLDANFFAFNDKHFELKVNIYKKGYVLFMNIPKFNFNIVNEFSSNDYEGIVGTSGPIGFTGTVDINGNEVQLALGGQVIGGYLNTKSNFLPKNICPLTDQTFIVPLSDGFMQSYSLTSLPYGPLPNVLPGLKIKINTFGNLSISGIGTINDYIPAGTHCIEATTISYLISEYHIPLGKNNLIVQKEFGNIVNFTNSDAINDSYRDTKINDFYNNIIALSWSSNAGQLDKTNNTTDVFVCVGTNKPVFVMNTIYNLTFNPPNVGIFDTAIAINKTNTSNIVCSFSINNYGTTGIQSGPYYCVTNNGGLNWTSPTLLQSNVSIGDCRGVISDMYGNFWYNYTDENQGLNVFFYMSSDQGQTWNLIYNTTDGQFSDISISNYYDYPQITLGQDGAGNYGLYWCADYFGFNGIDNTPRLGFIPITGLNQVGTPMVIQMTNFLNVQFTASMAVDTYGKLFIASGQNAFNVGIGIGPLNMCIKEPGLLSQNLISGPYSTTEIHQLYNSVTSYPVNGYSYFPQTVNCILFDPMRNVLYHFLNDQFNPETQNYELFVTVSPNKGISWSPRYSICNTVSQNRGFSSASVDPYSGEMIISWYDSRNSESGEGTQYFIRFICKHELDNIVKHLIKFM